MDIIRSEISAESQCTRLSCVAASDAYADSSCRTLDMEIVPNRQHSFWKSPAHMLDFPLLSLVIRGVICIMIFKINQVIVTLICVYVCVGGFVKVMTKRYMKEKKNKHKEMKNLNENVFLFRSQKNDGQNEFENITKFKSNWKHSTCSWTSIEAHCTIKSTTKLKKKIKLKTCINSSKILWWCVGGKLTVLFWLKLNRWITNCVWLMASQVNTALHIQEETSPAIPFAQTTNYQFLFFDSSSDLTNVFKTLICRFTAFCGFHVSDASAMTNRKPMYIWSYRAYN